MYVFLLLVVNETVYDRRLSSLINIVKSLGYCPLYVIVLIVWKQNTKQGPALESTPTEIIKKLLDISISYVDSTFGGVDGAKRIILQVRSTGSKRLCDHSSLLFRISSNTHSMAAVLTISLTPEAASMGGEQVPLQLSTTSPSQVDISMELV